MGLRINVCLFHPDMFYRADFELLHVDEFVDELLHSDRVCDIILPRLQVEGKASFIPRLFLIEEGRNGPRYKTRGRQQKAMLVVSVPDPKPIPAHQYCVLYWKQYMHWVRSGDETIRIVACPLSSLPEHHGSYQFCIPLPYSSLFTHTHSLTHLTHTHTTHTHTSHTHTSHTHTSHTSSYSSETTHLGTNGAA